MRRCVFFAWMLLSIMSMQSCRKQKESSVITPLVKVDKVVPYNTTNTITFSGLISTPGEINLSFRIPGMISNINFSEGAFVKKGEVIAQLDNQTYVEEYNAAEAKYNAVKQEASRVMELYTTNSTSPNNYDQAVGALQQAEAAYKLRALQLSYTKLIAPCEGYIQQKYFNANEVIGAGTPIVSLVNNKQLEIDVDIPSKDYIKRKHFKWFYCNADVYPNVILPLTYLDITRQANMNQLFKMRLGLSKPDELDLAPGMSVSVSIGYDEQDCKCTKIPVSALFKLGENSFVWKFNLADSTINAIAIDKIMSIENDGSAIVTSDLQGDDWIISAGAQGMKEGQKVRPLMPAPVSNVGNLL
ncbi:MAG: efflux RND transporter periplasmic adaptor subunit [Marinifilaceae bacterium]